MLLTCITANRHISVGRVNGKPLRLLLNFEGGRSLRLAVAGDGEQMIVDGLPIEAPVDLADAGAVDVADVTEVLDGDLRDAAVDKVGALIRNGRQVGVQLVHAANEAFHIWVDGDELHWGPMGTLIRYDWLHGLVPALGEAIPV